ncbi:MAG: AAA family ATPase, partial [Acidimicrobiales bacterium]
DLRDIERSVDRVAGHWNDSTPFDQEQYAALQRALAPTRRVRRLLRHEVEDRVEDLIKLTDQQVRALGFLRRQRRALITGGAGTGKTVLAAERVRQLAGEGMQVLFLCFNAPLGAKLIEDLDDVESATVGNFHKVARQIVADAGLLPETGFDDRTFWSDVLPGLLPDAAQQLGLTFDAIIVDEGQDFHRNWWTALELLLADPDDGFFYVFADDNQNVYRADWEAPFDGEPFLLDINCRNTTPIATRVGAVFDRDEFSLGVDGPAPAFVELSDLRQAPKRLGSVLEKLLGEEHMRPDQIVILTDERKLVDGLRGQQIGGHRLVEYGKKGIAVETVHRFKGLESDAVLLALGDVQSTAGRALAYVGMSRARVILFVLGTAETKAGLSWP